MARIIYSVSGVGYGHCSRADLVGQRLLDAANDLLLVGFGSAPSFLRPRFADRVVDIRGLSFYYTNGRIDRVKTFLYNLRDFARIARYNLRVLDSILDQFRPDLVLCDFEPFSGWWAVRRGLPVISVDNEHILTHCILDGPDGGYLDKALARLVTRAYVSGAQMYVVLSFFRVPGRNGSVMVVPPVVRPLIARLQPEDRGYVLVYLSTGQGLEQSIEILTGIKDTKFIVYGFDQEFQRGNCLFKKASVEGFAQDLAGCSAVICSAGFSLISECIFLGKPMLMLPVPGQYEQLVNAVYAERLGLGICEPTLRRTAVERLLNLLGRPRPVRRDLIAPDNEWFFESLSQAAARVDVDLHI